MSGLVRSDVVSVASAGRVSFIVFGVVRSPGFTVPMLWGEVMPAFGTVTYTVSVDSDASAFTTETSMLSSTTAACPLGACVMSVWTLSDRAVREDRVIDVLLERLADRAA